MVLQSGQKHFPLFTEDGIIFQPEKKFHHQEIIQINKILLLT